MPAEIYIVKVGMTMTEGAVEEWYVDDGATVAVGDMLYRLETEKVNMDVDAETNGTVKHLVEAGTTLEPGDVIGYIYAPDETIPATLPVPGKKAEAPVVDANVEKPDTPRSASTPAPASGDRIASTPSARRLAGELGVDLTSVTGTGPRGRITEADVTSAHAAAPAEDGGTQPGKSSPLARRVARELEVDIDTVDGTGPGGRITREDVEAAAAAAAASPSQQAADGAAVTVPVRGIRKVVATRMLESLHESAQLTMDMDVDMDNAVRLREQLISEWSDEGIRISYTDLVICAVSKALRQHPRMNSSFGPEVISVLDDIHVGMAVALEEGLVVPVIRNADQLSLKAISVEANRLADLARSSKLGLDDMSGGTFTVSALGMFGVDSFTPILNSPEAGILGVNRLRDEVRWNGEVPVKQRAMRLSLTWDHRVVDGAPAAQFLVTIKERLEQPYRLLV